MLIFADGSRYEGEFSSNDIHGEGTYAWPDKRIYKGTFYPSLYVIKDNGNITKCTDLAKSYGRMVENIQE